MALTLTPVCEFNKAASDFSLPGVDGKTWNLAKCRGPNGLLIMFICNHCPYVKSIRERLVQDAHELMGLGVGVAAIMSNDPTDYPEDSFENMQKTATDLQFKFPYLFDENQEVARTYGALCTPDFFGYNQNLQLQYRGRFDARGKEQSDQSFRRDLFNAMRQIAESGQGPREQFPSMGCSIKWKRD